MDKLVEIMIFIIIVIMLIVNPIISLLINWLAIRSYNKKLRK